MRMFFLFLAALLLFSTPAFAQYGRGGGHSEWRLELRPVCNYRGHCSMQFVNVQVWVDARPRNRGYSNGYPSGNGGYQSRPQHNSQERSAGQCFRRDGQTWYHPRWDGVCDDG
jgi:hypothetical protein